MFDAFQFEIGTMLTPLIWESQKEAHSKCNETQIFLCRSRICSRILFWYCAQTQFHDSNMQMMWCEKKTYDMFYVLHMDWNMYNFKDNFIAKNSIPHCLQIQFHDGSRKKQQNRRLCAILWVDWARMIS